MNELKKEIENLSENKSATGTYILKAKEWKNLCNKYDISNKYFFKNEEDEFNGGVELDSRGFKKIYIIAAY